MMSGDLKGLQPRERMLGTMEMPGSLDERALRASDHRMHLRDNALLPVNFALTGLQVPVLAIQTGVQHPPDALCPAHGTVRATE